MVYKNEIVTENNETIVVKYHKKFLVYTLSNL